MNVLVMSISNKIPMLKAIRSAIGKMNKSQKLYGADSNNNCIGQFFVDEFWHCPPLLKLSLNELLRYCMDNKITYIFPSRDGELTYFAFVRSELEKKGIYVMVSDEETIQLCIDKQLFYNTLAFAGYPIIPTSSQIMEHYDLFVVKERFGAGSDGVALRLSAEEAINKLPEFNVPIVQPYISGTEYSIDLYISIWTSKAIGIVVRQRNLVVRGESQISVTCRNIMLERICSNIAEQFKFRGHVIFQVLIDDSGKIHIIECNARFGGASTLSLAAGLDSFYWFMEENSHPGGKPLLYNRSKEEKTLIRHPEDFII